MQMELKAATETGRSSKGTNYANGSKRPGTAQKQTTIHSVGLSFHPRTTPSLFGRSVSLIYDLLVELRVEWQTLCCKWKLHFEINKFSVLEIINYVKKKKKIGRT